MLVEKSAKFMRVIRFVEETAKRFVEADLENLAQWAPLIENYFMSCLVAALKSFTEPVDVVAI